MGDLYRHAGALADRDRLADGVEEPRPLVAPVGGIEPPRSSYLARQRDDLVAGRIPSRLVDQPRRESDAAGVEPLAHQIAHAAELGRVRRAIRPAQHRGAHAAVPYERSRVAARWL